MLTLPQMDIVAVDEELPVLTLVEPILGFPEHRRYALVQLDESGLMCSLRSLDQEGLRFLVVPPGPFFPDYEPEIDDELVTALGIEPGDPLVTLVLVSAHEDPEVPPTANLLAPVVVNHRTRLAAQAVQGTDLPVRADLWPAASAG